MVVPEALRVTRLRPGRRFTNLGRMCSEVGWKHWDTIKTLEAKRKTKSSAFWAKKKEVIQVTGVLACTVSASKYSDASCFNILTQSAFAAAEEGG